MRILCAISLLTAGLCLGIRYAVLLRLRRGQLGEILRLIRILRREIRCSSLPLAVILENVETEVSIPLLSGMRKTAPFDLVSAYEAAWTENREKIFLNAADRKKCDDLFHGLTRGDRRELELHLERCEETFQGAEKDAERILRQDGKASVLFGGCAGGLAALLFVL